MTTLESRISIPEHVLLEEVDGEAVILNLDSGKYFGLDEVGTRMWALLAQHGELAAAHHALLKEYDVSGDQLQQDLVELVDNLAAHGLLQISEA